ncbi:hypothetical protein [Runella sp.]|uniref:hypothetical protein n=1 Tax=Runella sp. TaxID=1960881 RepID=UPI003D137EDF
MILQYVAHTKSSKFIHLQARALTQKVVYESNLTSKIFGASEDDLRGCMRGIQSEIDHFPRINCGFLSTYIKVEMEIKSVKVYHETTNDKKLLCEVVEGGEACVQP